MKEEQFRKAFENVAPSEELVNKVLAFNGNTAPIISVQRKAHIRRIVCTSAAVFAVMICGLTVAAAAGVFDFKEVFGKFINVIDSSRASSLAAASDTLTYKVSDDDYMIRVKGITGSQQSIIAVVELCRKDGEPVSEYFANPTDETHLTCLWRELKMTNTMGCGYGFYVNDAGNIEFHFDIDSNESLNGQTFTACGENFYPTYSFWNFCDENQTSYLKTHDFSGYVAPDEKGIYGSDSPPKEVDDSSVLALKLEWEFSFEYQASEDSLKTKSCIEPAEPFTLHKNNSTLDPDYISSLDLDDEHKAFISDSAITVKRIDIGSLGGSIEIGMELSEYEQSHFINPVSYFNSPNTENEMFLCLENGETLPVQMDGSSGSNNNGVFTGTWNVSYGSGGIKEIADLEKVTAISINGTVYELK